MSAVFQSTITNDSLNRSIGLSAALHLAVFLLLYFGLPHFMPPLPVPAQPIPFEIVEIADITNTRIKEKEEQPAPPAPPPAPAPKAWAAPEPLAKPVEKVEALLPKPTEKPKPPQEAKPKQDPLASVLKDVAKLKPSESKIDAKAPPKDQAKDQPKSLAPSLSDRLTITEEDALRRQIEQCWSPPIGARDAQNLVVEVSIAVNPDRTVASAEVVDKVRMASDPYFRAAGEAAIRAVLNPRCSPLELPDGKYDQWKNIDFTFDPRDFL